MSKIPAVAFAHVGLNVRDLERMERFYTGFLGLIVTDRGQLGSAQLVFMSRNAREHHQVVLVSGPPPGEGYSVLNQVSLRVKDLDALRSRNGAAASSRGSPRPEPDEPRDSMAQSPHLPTARVAHDQATVER